MWCFADQGGVRDTGKDSLLLREEEDSETGLAYVGEDAKAVQFIKEGVKPRRPKGPEVQAKSRPGKRPKTHGATRDLNLVEGAYWPYGRHQLPDLDIECPGIREEMVDMLNTVRSVRVQTSQKVKKEFC